MLTPTDFRELVSGRRRGWNAALLRGLLATIEPFYALAVKGRNWRYDRGAAPVHRMPVPVISVGNLSLGGTGKTPMVEWIARRLGQQGLRAALVSRGYGRQRAASAGDATTPQNDEALELAQRLPEVPHVQNPDRVAAARRAIDEHGAQVIVLDDAFQHRRIGRDLDIVLLDALEPFGFGHVFPRGTLREPPAGLRRAHVVALSRADMLSASQREELRRQVAAYAPEATWAETIHAPQALLAHDGQRESLDALGTGPVAAFCGIGNPAGFRHTLAACGYQVAAWREFPDHHAYTPADVDQLQRWADGLDVAAVLCTHKDLVKLSSAQIGSRRLRAVSIGLQFLHGEERVTERLHAVLAKKG